MNDRYYLFERANGDEDVRCNTLDEAVTTARRVLGCEPYLSPSYSVGNDYGPRESSARSLYRTAEDCDADKDDGHYAPRIVEVRL